MEKSLNQVGATYSVAARLKADIDEFCATHYDDGWRNHLGGSEIGDSCNRKLWYGFRWCFKETFSGRMQRLFNRGHKEEARIVEWLRGVGCEVWEVDPETGKQFRVSGVNGHFGGSLDGIVKLPPSYGIDTPVLLEMKTSSAKAFEKMIASGMVVAKPVHFAQTSTYGSYSAYNFSHVLYVMVNKNDDELHVELVKLDHEHGKQLRAKAERIILSQEAPPRLSDNPTFHVCKYCPMLKLCHEGESPLRNCRSCKFARPVENAEWFCDFHDGIIPKEYIPESCQFYTAITGQ